MLIKKDFSIFRYSISNSLKHVFMLVLFVVLITGCGTTDPADVDCNIDVPDPVLAFTGTEDYTVDGVEYTRYKLEVTNSDAIPDELFEAASYLPACGSNTDSSRTWIDIYDQADTRLYGFCALGESNDLLDIWFALPKGDTPPESVYIVLNDRACEAEYVSNIVYINADCYPDLPSPEIVIEGTVDYQGSDGNTYTRYMIDVTNWASFPDELFAAAPDLPACGINTNSSRTWVDIYDETDTRLYGFCALGTSENMNDIWFALPQGTTPPASIYIVLTDRACETEYVSNSAGIHTDFIGDWLNEDVNTDGITRVEITLNGDALDVHEWGQCSPEDCDWGIEFTPIDDTTDGMLDLFWDQGFAERTQTLELVASNRLKLTNFSHYTDGSGRADVTHIYYFVK